MSKMKSHNRLNDPYFELQEEDRQFGGRKLERPESEMRRDRRPLKNLKKAWMEHTDDYDEVDE